MRPPARRGAPFREGCLGRLVGRRVQRSRLLPRQLQAAQDPREAGRAQPLVEAALDPAAQHRQGPAGAAVLGAVGAAEDRVQERRLLGLGQHRGPARPALGRSRRPSSPSPSQRTTASRGACRSMPASRAASARPGPCPPARRRWPACATPPAGSAPGVPAAAARPGSPGRSGSRALLPSVSPRRRTRRESRPPSQQDQRRVRTSARRYKASSPGRVPSGQRRRLRADPGAAAGRAGLRRPRAARRSRRASGRVAPPPSGAS